VTATPGTLVAQDAEVALLRSLALAASEASAAGAALPEPVAGTLDIWLNAGWMAEAPPDQGFAQGYLAALEVAARHCLAAADTRGNARRRSWIPLRRHTLRQSEAALRAMAVSLRLMADGVRLHGA
jgi:hypothetical protein